MCLLVPSANTLKKSTDFRLGSHYDWQFRLFESKSNFDAQKLAVFLFLHVRTCGILTWKIVFGRIFVCLSQTPILRMELMNRNHSTFLLKWRIVSWFWISISFIQENSEIRFLYFGILSRIQINSYYSYTFSYREIAVFWRCLNWINGWVWKIE